MHDSTLTADGLSLAQHSASLQEVPALVVTWCADQPALVGAVMLLNTGKAGAVHLFGRGETSPDDLHPRLKLYRQRPGVLEAAGVLTSPHVSREQLHVRVAPDGRLSIRRVGRLRLLHAGEEIDEVALYPGDVIELRNVLQLMVVRRPTLLPSLPNPRARLHPFGEPDSAGLVGESPVLWDLRQRLEFIAGREGHVLVLGESGTGKELVARAIHLGSTRASRPLVARNAATFPETLIDAELFGNARNYPNPGMLERSGIIGEADGSTLFLDEIGELPLALQAHLLRVLDRGEYQRLGESAQRHSDFRFIAATNRAPEELKHDILARLGWRLSVPDLNQRREDIPLLVRHLLRRMAEKDPGLGRFFKPGPDPEPRVTPAMMRTLLRHRYTTHVRELQALLLHAMSHTLGSYIDLCPGLPIDEEPLELARETPEIDADAIPPAVIQAALDRHNGVQAKVWQELGLKSRFVLIRLIKKYDLNVRQIGRGEGD